MWFASQWTLQKHSLKHFVFDLYSLGAFVPEIKATSNSWFRSEMKDELPRDSSTVDNFQFENLSYGI